MWHRCNFSRACQILHNNDSRKVESNDSDDVNVPVDNEV